MSDEIYTIKKSTLTGIANAVRSKSGKSGDIPVPNLESEILSIPTGGGGGTDSNYDFLTYEFVSDTTIGTNNTKDNTYAEICDIPSGYEVLYGMMFEKDRYTADTHEYGIRCCFGYGGAVRDTLMGSVPDNTSADYLSAMAKIIYRSDGTATTRTANINAARYSFFTKDGKICFRAPYSDGKLVAGIKYLFTFVLFKIQ